MTGDGQMERIGFPLHSDVGPYCYGVVSMQPYGLCATQEWSILLWGWYNEVFHYICFKLINGLLASWHSLMATSRAWEQFYCHVLLLFPYPFNSTCRWSASGLSQEELLTINSINKYMFMSHLLANWSSPDVSSSSVLLLFMLDDQRDWG